MDKKDRKKIAILEILQSESQPVSSSRIAQILKTSDVDFSERAVRMYLQQLDREGLTVSVGRKGRLLTDAGKELMYEAQTLQTLRRVGYMSSRIDQMIYRMSFDLATCEGKIITNTSFVDPHVLASCVDDICSIFDSGFGMGTRVYLLHPGEEARGMSVPYDKVGFCTVCTITLNGVLLKNGVPMNSRFAGLLKYENRKPTCFTEIVHYNGTSIDPLEMFIRAGLTDFHGAVLTGNGLVGAGYREIPMESRSRVEDLDAQLRDKGLGAFVYIGHPNQDVFGVPVSEGRIGAVTIGGLNPIAVLEEKGYRVYSRALSGLMDYPKMFHYKELPRRIREFL